MFSLPSDHEIKDRFERLGYVAPIRIISKEDAAACRAELETFERAHPDKVGLIDMKANLLFRWIDRLTRNETLMRAVEPLIGPNVLCENVGFRNKAPDNKTYVSWHQDTVYLKFEPRIITCWLALTPATVENGCLKIIPGSHKWGDMPHKEKVDPYSMLTRGHYVSTEFDTSNATYVTLEAGEGLLIDTAVLHASEPNLTKDRRMGMLIDMVPASGKKLNGRESAMLVHGHDRWGHFDHEVPPEEDFGEAERERHRKAVEAVIATFYAGSERKPEALSGKSRNAV